MEVQLSEKQADLIKKIARDEGFTEFELKTTSGSCKGDNYLGIITTVSVKNHQKKIELILKAASDSEEFRKRVPIRNAFLREMFLYKTIFPKFKNFETEEGFLDGFSAHAKLYGCCDEDFNEFLVMENLKTNGYDLWNRRVPMTADHIALVLKESGKFHAISLAMKEKKPELYEQLSEKLNHVFAEMGSSEEYTAVIDNILDNGFKAIKGDQFATDAFRRFSDIVQEFLTDTMKTPDENSVILHGDSWCNNILFKHEDGEKIPSKVCLIDWQISWVGSPALDLCYFLFTSSPKEILADYKKYLKIYHDSLCDSLRNLHCDPEILFPYTLLESHWQKYAKFGIYMALTLLKLMLSDGHEVPDIKEIADSGKTFAEGFSFETVHNDTYNRRISDIIRLSAENNWI